MKLVINFFIIFFSLSVQSQRLITTSPSVCYTLIDLGLSNKIVGSSNYCQIKTEKIGSLLTPNIEKIISLRPNFVLSQKIKNDQLSKKLEKLGIKSKSYPFNTYNDVKESLESLSTDFNEEEKGNELIQEFLKLEKKLLKLNLKGKFAFAIAIKERSGKVVGFTIAGKDTYFSDVIASTGLVNVITTSRGYLEWDIEKFIKAKIKYLIILSKDNEQLDERVKKQLNRYKGVQILKVGSLGAHVPSSRTILFLEELYKGLNVRSK
ncbi:ABC transporter substrate-binding protein [Bacteriovoracaceae bacterium]|nr:ABC transporter substrate-binding protein [Bacteriovoracaceae bacterium]